MTAWHYDRTLQLTTGEPGGAVLRLTESITRDDGSHDIRELSFALTDSNLRKLEKHLRKARVTKRKITTLRY